MTDKKRDEVIINTNKIANKIISSHTDNEYLFSLQSDDIKNAFEYYEIIKEQVKKFISNTEFNQDRHKIASTSIISLLSFKPIVVNKYPKDITEIEATLWINQILAIAVAEYIIFDFLDKPTQKLILPNTTTSGKNYSDYLIGLINSISDNITFKETDIAKLANYITSLSHILYLLEKYTLDK